MAWTTPRTWTANETVTASMMNTHVRDDLNMLYRIAVRKGTATSRSTNTTPSADPELTFAIAASETWVWTAFVVVDGDPAGDFLWYWTGPTSSTVTHGGLGIDIAATDPGNLYVGTDGGNGGGASGQLSTGLFGGAGNQTVVPMWGSVLNSTNAGSVTLSWSQRASSGTATRVNVGSHLIAHRIS